MILGSHFLEKKELFIVQLYDLNPLTTWGVAIRYLFIVGLVFGRNDRVCKYSAAVYAGHNILFWFCCLYLCIYIISISHFFSWIY